MRGAFDTGQPLAADAQQLAERVPIKGKNQGPVIRVTIFGKSVINWRDACEHTFASPASHGFLWFPTFDFEHFVSFFCVFCPNVMTMVFCCQLPKYVELDFGTLIILGDPTHTDTI